MSKAPLARTPVRAFAFIIGRMSLRSLRAATACFLLAACASLAAGPAVPPAPTRFVTDRAGVLSPEVTARLEKVLESFEQDTSNQFLVYTEPKIPEATTLEEYTVACAQAWRAGQTQKKNGLVLFVFPESRAARFEVGYGLEGALPDALASRVMSEQILPRFRGGDFSGGIEAGVSSAIAATKGEYKGTGRRRGAVRRGGDGGIPWPLILFVVLFVLPALLGRRRSRYWWIGGGGSGGGGFGGWGGGGGGGGFSGGGGSFGGGGASGRW